MPPTSNLTSHTRGCTAKHGREHAVAAAAAANKDVPNHGFTRNNAAMMADWMAKGALNPAVNPTKKGFL